MTRLGLIQEESFNKYMEDGGFVQEVPHDTGYLVPLHHFTFVLPHTDKLSNDTMYHLYMMYSCFVRQHMIMDSESYLACSNDDTMFLLRVVHWFEEYEDVICFLKQNNYGETDFYSLAGMANHEQGHFE